MKKIKVLEVNNIDILGRRFNGYDLIEDLSNDNFDVKQAVVFKKSDCANVINILNDSRLIDEFYYLENVESRLSIHNVFSITTPALINTKEYMEADIIHFHMFHNTKLSIYSLIKISQEKKVVITFHDPWFLTGRCVHFYDCNKWKNGCKNCEFLNTLFSFEDDNCNVMWKLKKKVFENIDIDIIVSSVWMKNLVMESPFFEHQKNIHLIPFGVNIEKFNNINPKDARKYFGIEKDEVVFFLRAQNEFKGTLFVLDAFKKLISNKKIVILTCDKIGLLDSLNNKYKVIDLGIIGDDVMLKAYQACDIFLNASIAESFCMMAVEAMASGKPVIIFNNTALPSITYAPKCGYLVKNKNVDDLVRAMSFLIDNKTERIRRGNLGRKICKDVYNLEEYNNQIKKVYEFSNKRVHINKNIKVVEQQNNKTIKEVLQDINNKKLKEKKYDIDYSDFYVQEKIYKFNNDNFKKIINQKNNLGYRLKRLLRKNKYIYSFIKKIMKRGN